MVYPQDIVLKPIITEKSSSLNEQNKYVFKVRIDANKIEIGKAVAALFKVTVTDVKTMRVPGKMKRQGKNEGMTPAWKKAIVTLKDGDSIPIFEGV